MKPSSSLGEVCMRCTGANIVSGKIISSRQDAAHTFKPDNMKFWSFSFSGGVGMQKNAFGCLDCGFIWSEADAEALASFVAKKCKPMARKAG